MYSQLPRYDFVCDRGEIFSLPPKEARELWLSILFDRIVSPSRPLGSMTLTVGCSDGETGLKDVEGAPPDELDQ